MCWTRVGIAAVLAGSIAIAASSSARAEPLVISYQGQAPQNYKPGKKLPANQSLTLKPGEVLTVLDERGTRTLRGPGVFSTSSAANAGSVTPASLMNLVKTTPARRARTGAVRGTPGAATPTNSPNLWFIDIRKSATVCVADFANVRLWRPDIAEPQSVVASSLTASGLTSSGAASFLKGQSTAPWPNQVAPIDGGRYSLTGLAKSSPTTITMVQIKVAGTEVLVELASALLDKGCQSQAELLAATFAQGAATANPRG